jgi:hypothetical protein
MRFEFITRFTDIHEFNNGIMFTQVETNMAGKINAMGSGDGMSWKIKSGKYGGAI